MNAQIRINGHLDYQRLLFGVGVEYDPGSPRFHTDHDVERLDGEREGRVVRSRFCVDGMRQEDLEIALQRYSEPHYVRLWRRAQLEGECDRRLADSDQRMARALEDVEARGDRAWFNRLREYRQALRTIRAGLADALAALDDEDAIMAHEPGWPELKEQP